MLSCVFIFLLAMRTPLKGFSGEHFRAASVSIKHFGCAENDYLK